MRDGLADERRGIRHGAVILGCNRRQVNEEDSSRPERAKLDEMPFRMSFGASRVYGSHARQQSANCFRHRVELRLLDYEAAALQFSSILQTH